MASLLRKAGWHTCCSSRGREKCSQLILYTRDAGSPVLSWLLWAAAAPFSGCCRMQPK